MNATRDVLPYYAEGGFSAIFHDLLAELEPGCKGDAAFYLSLLHINPGRVLELGCGAGRLSYLTRSPAFGCNHESR